MKKTSILLFSILFIGCSSSTRYGFWDISKFNLVPGALENKSSIKFIYSYRGPTGGEKKDWYNHHVVVSMKTGDTVNVLTMSYPAEEYDKNKVYTYFDTGEIITKMSALDGNEVAKVKNWDSVKIENRAKVCRDTQFDKITDNKFPTVIGSIGTITGGTY